MNSQSLKDFNFSYSLTSQSNKANSTQYLTTLSPIKPNKGSLSSRDLKDGKSSFDSFPNQGNNIIIAQNPNSQPKVNANRSNERRETLRIFKSSLQNISDFDRPSPQKRKIFLGQIKAGDSPNTIKALIKQGKNDLIQKKLKRNKGTMYVNDLWGTGYRKEVVKHSAIEQEINALETKPSKFQIAYFEKALGEPKSARVKKSSEFPEVTLTSSKGFFEHSKSPEKTTKIPKAQGSLRKISTASKFVDTQKNIYSELEYYPIPKNYSRASKNLNQSISTTAQTLPSQINKSPLKDPTSIEDSHHFEDNSVKGRSFETSHYGFSLNSTSAGSKEFQRFSQTIRTRTEKSADKKQNWFKLENINRSYLEDVKNSNMSSSRELESTRTRLFIDEKNVQVSQLVGNCETELRKREGWMRLMNGLEDLFANHKYDKWKKLENLKKQGMINECQLMLNKRKNKNSSIKLL